MADRPLGHKSVKCRATTRRGTPCGNDAIRGGVVCRSHGGQLPVVQRRAEERMAVWEAMQLSDRRDPAHILLDVAHSFDVLMKEARHVVETSTASPEEITRFIEACERAGKWAHTTISAGALDRLSRRATNEGEELAGIVNRALAAAHLHEECDTAIRRCFADEARRMDDPTAPVRAITAVTSDEPAGSNGSRPSSPVDVEAEVVPESGE